MIDLSRAIESARRAAWDLNSKILDETAWAEIFAAAMPEIIDALADDAETEPMRMEGEWQGLPPVGAVKRMARALKLASEYQEAAVGYMRGIAEEMRRRKL
jgi:hypothetical protein